MKKIKGILLFGILTLLGIGSSFGVFFELNDLTGNQLLIPNYSYTHHGTYYSTYNYTLGDVSYHSGEFLYLNNAAARALYVCRDSNLNILGFSTYGSLGDLSYGNTILFGDISNCNSFNKLSNFEYVYLSNSIPISPYSTRSTGNINSYIYFDDNFLYTNYGSVRDIPTGYLRQKLFLSSVGNYGIFSTGSDGDYLFTSIGRDSFNIEDLGDGLYNFDLDIYSGILELHYSDYSLPYYSGSRTVILSLGSGVVYFNFYTGYYYGIKEIQAGVLPLYKGYLTYNNSSSEGYTQFINFLNNGHKIVLSSRGTNGISFTSYGYYYFTQTNLGGGYFTTTSNLTLDFEFDDSVPTFITPSGNGNQSTGSIAINTGLINLCLTSSSFYNLNTVFCNRVFGGRDLSYYQGLIGSGAYLQSYIDGSGNLVYVIDVVDEPGVLTGGVVWECYGDRCINTESGSWGDVEPWEILHLSGGDILSSGYYLGFFESINETGYFFKCPYSYNNNRWVAGRSILNAIGRDPFLPINCFIAAYENGRRVKLFDEAFNGYSWGPLMNGDTQNHRNLFTFFDILLSVALIFFLMKFYHLFK